MYILVRVSPLFLFVREMCFIFDIGFINVLPTIWVFGTYIVRQINREYVA